MFFAVTSPWRREATPPAVHLWGIDAGAVRRFGRATVANLLGLNTPEALGPQRQRWLSRKRATFLGWVLGWNEFEPGTRAPEPAGMFQALSDYTVTRIPFMETNVLSPCPAGTSGWVRTGGCLDRFDCAEARRAS